jgi:hypothetical protein
VAGGKDNLIPEAHKLTLEEQSAGGKKSGEVRREKATMKKTLEMLLNEKNKKGQTYRDLATLGLIKGAIDGKADNYKTIVALLGELEEHNETPVVNINVVDNTDLEKVMYEEEQK